MGGAGDTNCCRASRSSNIRPGQRTQPRPSAQGSAAHLCSSLGGDDTPAQWGFVTHYTLIMHSLLLVSSGNWEKGTVQGARTAHAVQTGVRHNRNQKAKVFCFCFSSKAFNYLIITFLLLLTFPSRLAKIQAGSPNGKI